MEPWTRAAIDRLEASGLIAEALAAFRVDHVYAVEIVREHHRMVSYSEGAAARAAARGAELVTDRVATPEQASQG